MPRVLEDIAKLPFELDRATFSLKQKKVIAKVLYQHGWGSPTISRWLNISKGTILKASRQPTPTALSMLEFQLNSQLEVFGSLLMLEIEKQIMEIVSYERDINKLVEAGYYFQKWSIIR